MPAAMTAVEPHATSGATSAPTKTAEKNAKEPEHAVAMASVAPRNGSFTRPVMMKSKGTPTSIEPPTLSGAAFNSINNSSANTAMDKSPLAEITGTSSGPAAPAAPSNMTTNMTNGVTPQLLSHPAPVYPLLARENHTEGDVSIQLVIDKSGNVTSATVITGPLVLRDAALQAVRRWKYQPLGAQATQAKALVTLRFRM
jgi:TonB family protein